MFMPISVIVEFWIVPWWSLRFSWRVKLRLWVVMLRRFLSSFSVLPHLSTSLNWQNAKLVNRLDWVSCFSLVTLQWVVA